MNLEDYKALYDQNPIYHEGALRTVPKEDFIEAYLYPFQKDTEGLEPVFDREETSPNGEYVLSIYNYPVRGGCLMRIHRQGVLVVEVKRNFRFHGSGIDTSTRGRITRGIPSVTYRQGRR